MAQTLGNNYWLFWGPVILTLALGVGIWLTVSAARRQWHYGRRPGTTSRHDRAFRGTVKGEPDRRDGRPESPRRDGE